MFTILRNLDTNVCHLVMGLTLTSLSTKTVNPIAYNVQYPSPATINVGCQEALPLILYQGSSPILKR